MAANGISTLDTKELRQVAKLELAQTKRLGWTVAGNGTVPGSVSLDIGSHLNLSTEAGVTAYFVDHGGAFNSLAELWYVYDHPTWIVTNVQFEARDGITVTIRDGIFQPGVSYAFGSTLLTNPNTNAQFYRARNHYDINLLPEQYVGNVATHNTEPLPLQAGRPWINLPLPQYNIILEDGDQLTLETGFDDFVTE